MSKKLYPDSKIELTTTIAKHYDSIMNLVTLGKYHDFIRRAIGLIELKPGCRVLDMGCGTGRNAALLKERMDDDSRLTGIDISPQMERQFRDRFSNDERFDFFSQRIDVPLELGTKYDVVLISFVIHGFPQEIRKKILQNAVDHLAVGGRLYILDYNEFDMERMPAHHRFVFKTVECKYAFDFLNYDWKSILKDYGLGEFTEKLFYNQYVRLLSARKQDS